MERRTRFIQLYVGRIADARDVRNYPYFEEEGTSAGKLSQQRSREEH